MNATCKTLVKFSSHFLIHFMLYSKANWVGSYCMFFVHTVRFLIAIKNITNYHCQNFTLSLTIIISEKPLLSWTKISFAWNGKNDESDPTDTLANKVMSADAMVDTPPAHYRCVCWYCQRVLADVLVGSDSLPLPGYSCKCWLHVCFHGYLSGQGGSLL